MAYWQHLLPRAWPPVSRTLTALRAPAAATVEFGHVAHHAYARTSSRTFSGAPYDSGEARRLEKRRITMKKILSILLAVSILTGVVGQTYAADVSGSKEYEQPEREIR